MDSLQHAINIGSWDLVVKLINQGADVNATDNYGRTPLHYAVQRCLGVPVDVLVDYSADVKAVDNDSRTPLHDATYTRSRDIIILLILNGADVKAQDKDGRTALHIVAKSPSLEATEMLDILLEYGADIQAQDKDGRTVLHIVVQSPSLKAIQMLRVLLSHGADIQAQGRDKRRAPDKAVARNDESGKINSADNNGKTPLHLAAEAGYNSIVELPLSAGATESIGLADNDGNTPLDLATKAGHKSMVDLLVALGRELSLSLNDIVVKPPGPSSDRSVSTPSDSTPSVHPREKNIVVLQDQNEIQVYWRCRCNRKFEARIPGTDLGAAEDFLRCMDWNVERDGPLVRHRFKSEWLENLVWAVAPGLLGKFPWEKPASVTQHSDLEARGDIGLADLTPDSSDSVRQDLETTGTHSTIQITHTNEPRYICLYMRKDNSWRLRHAKVSEHTQHNPHNVPESQTRISGRPTERDIEQDYSANMDNMLFCSLRKKFLGNKWTLSSLWKIFSPISVSGLEFWEFKLNPAPKLVDPLKKDKLPHEDHPAQLASQESSSSGDLSGEWEYNILSRQDLSDFKGLIGGSYPLHLLKYPNHALPASPIWRGIPKKIGMKLVNPQNTQKIGWGFQVEHEWNSKAFTLMTCPIIILGFIIATWLCIKFHWPASAGVTVALAPVTVVTYVNNMLGGIAKQKGLSK